MELKREALNQQREYLKQHLGSAEVQAALSQGSYHIATGIVSEIIQKPLLLNPPAQSYSPIYSPGTSANNPPAQLYSPDQLKQITGEIIAVLQGGGQQETGPLAAGPVQTSTGNMPRRDRAHRAPKDTQAEKDQTQK